MKFALTIVALALTASVGSTQTARASKGASEMSHINIAVPGSITWGPGPASLPKGATLAVLDGDPTKPGSFTMRLSLPGGYRVQPHFHPADEHVTVVSGTLYIGMGDTFDESKGTELPTHAFVALARDTRHFAFTKTPTIIQLHGTGPWTITYANPKDDPRGATK